MALCDVCGNDYWMTFEVRTVTGESHTFDSFECAIHKLAPVCEHCGCKIVGHGVEANGRFFCCAHCARATGVEHGEELRDAVGAHHG
jgi:phage terminase large subunit GpA-like protein